MILDNYAIRYAQKYPMINCSPYDKWSFSILISLISFRPLTSLIQIKNSSSSTSFEKALNFTQIKDISNPYFILFYFRKLNGHENFVYSLAILHNGDLTSGSQDDTIKIWNSTDGTLKQTLNSNEYGVFSLVVLHNGNLVSGSGTIKIWNGEKYEVERTLTNHTNWVVCLTVFPNTDFASGSYDNTIIIWSSNGDYKRTLHGHTEWVRSLVVLPSGKLASGSDDKTIKIWSADGNLEKTLTGHSNLMRSLAVLDNGYWASGSWDYTTKIWNENGELMYTHQYDSYVLSLAVCPNGDLLIGSHIIRIKDKNKLDSQEVSVLSEHSSLINSLAVFSNGDFASASNDKTIIIWSQN